MKSACIFGAYFDEPVVMAPGTQGGMSWAPMTFSPDTHLVYLPGSIINSRRFRRTAASRGRPTRPCRHAHGHESRDEQDRLAEATEVSDRRRQRACSARRAGLIFHGESDGRLSPGT